MFRLSVTEDDCSDNRNMYYKLKSIVVFLKYIYNNKYDNNNANIQKTTGWPLQH